MISKVTVLALIALGLIFLSATTEGQRRDATVGQNYVFTDSTNRSRLDSHLFCKDSGGELTKITNGGVFTMLTRHSTIPAGEYWIDGTQQVGILSSEKHCSNDSVNLAGIPRANNDLPQVLCLSLTKTSNATGHKVHLDNCGVSKGVICSVPSSGVCPLAPA